MKVMFRIATLAVLLVGLASLSMGCGGSESKCSKACGKLTDCKFCLATASGCLSEDDCQQTCEKSDADEAAQCILDEEECSQTAFLSCINTMNTALTESE